MSFARTIGLMVILVGIALTGNSQELPIAVGNDDTFSGGGAFDGTKYCLLIQGDNTSPYSITAQFVSRNGNPVGQRLSLGYTGSNPVLAFDGSNYLAVWTDVFPRMANGDTNGIGDLHAQFISPSGSLLGSMFTPVTGVNIKFSQGRGGLTFQDSSYMLFYCKGGNHIDVLYGQRLSRSGSLLGAPFRISEGYAREASYAFDGTNYLVSWCEIGHPALDKDIYGQFVSASGSLVGKNFLIDGGDYASDNPVSMAYDGSRFWVGFHELAADGSERWNLWARFVSRSGAIADRFMVCDSTKSPTFATAAFDGNYYLITWMEMTGTPRVRGRFFNASGIPVDSAFTVFDALQGKFPVGGVGGFVDDHFLLSATRLDQNMANGDIYWRFLQRYSTDVREGKTSMSPSVFSLCQNYPNPFNPSTTIQYVLPHRSHVTLTVFTTLGQKVAELVNGEFEAGSHEVQLYADHLASGTYFYRLQAGSFVQTRSLLVLR